MAMFWMALNEVKLVSGILDESQSFKDGYWCFEVTVFSGHAILYTTLTVIHESLEAMPKPLACVSDS